MDPNIARMFNTDKTYGQYVFDRDVRDSFVKEAQAVGVRLDRMTDGEIARLFGTYRKLAAQAQARMTKEAEMVRIGRLLAHKMLGMDKTAQGFDFNKADPEQLVGHLRHMHRTGKNPALFQRYAVALQKNPDFLRELAAQGADPATIKDLMQDMGMSPAAIKPFEEDFGKAFRHSGAARRANRAAQVVALMAQGGRPPQFRLDKSMDILIREGRNPGAAAADAAETGIERFLPFGVGKAIKGKDWGTVMRKLGPVGALAGAGAYMVHKKNRDRAEADMTRNFQDQYTQQIGVPVPPGGVNL